MQELWERPTETLRREVEVMTAHLPHVAERGRYEHQIQLREEEIGRRSAPPRAEIENLKAAWESFSEAERLELAAWIRERV
jgi:hypothetical protein